MRKLAVLAAVCLMVTLLAPGVQADIWDPGPQGPKPGEKPDEPNPNLKLWGKPVDIHLNGEWIVKWQDALPFIQEDPPWRTMVPVRFISEKLGAKVTWVQEEQKAVIELGDKKIELWVGKNTAKVNGQEVELDASIWLQSEPAWRIFAPLRFVTECLGGKVEWTPPGGLSKSKEYPGQKIVIDEVVITYPASAE
ncbi:MAG: copper amine oxidase N-terminal domain-containing protein [Bacillota bacterium]